MTWLLVCKWAVFARLGRGTGTLRGSMGHSIVLLDPSNMEVQNVKMSLGPKLDRLLFLFLFFFMANTHIGEIGI